MFYAWDEISNEISVNLTTCCDVGEEDENGWTRRPDIGPVRVFSSSRGHVGLEVDADSPEEAAALFAHHPLFQETHK